MKTKTIIMMIFMTTLLFASLNIVPVTAHGGNETSGGGGMPGFPWMPGMPGMGDRDHMPGYEMGEEAVWITSEDMVVMAAEEMPAFHFWFAGDDNGSMARFMAAYSGIAEFVDSNGDGAFQFNESIAYAPLSAFEWTVQTGTIEDDDGHVTEVWLKYTKGGIKVETDEEHHMMDEMGIPCMYEESADVERFENVTIQLWAHLYSNDYNGIVVDSEGIKANYTVVGGSELKVDIEIGNFPFSSNTSMIAIQTMLHENMATGFMRGPNHMFVTRERYRNVTGNSFMNWTAAMGNESRFENMPDTHMQQIDFRDATTNITQGFYRWVDKAVINWPGGVSEAVNVTASYAPTGMGLSLFFAYPNFDNGTLVHDPSLGLVEDAHPAPSILATPWISATIIGGASIVGIVAVAVIVARRRK